MKVPEVSREDTFRQKASVPDVDQYGRDAYAAHKSLDVAVHWEGRLMCHIFGLAERAILGTPQRIFTHEEAKDGHGD